MRRPFLIASALAALAAPLAACGFEPLYGQETGVAPLLSRTEVIVPDTRTGALLREEMDDELARGEGAPAYRLAIDLREDRFARGLRIDDTANRYELRLTVGYELTDTRTRQVLTAGSRLVYVTYDSADQPYSGVAAHADGQERAASEAARIVRTELAKFFYDQRRGAAPVRTAAVR